VLEMVKLGLMGIHQAQGSDALELERVVDVDAMNEAVAVFREEGEEDEDPAELAAITPEPPDPVTPVAGEDPDPATPVAGDVQVEATAATRTEAELEVASLEPFDGEREGELEVEAEADRLDEMPELAVADVVEPDVVEPEVENLTVAPDEGATE
jgi:segregation and condensation protein A